MIKQTIAATNDHVENKLIYFNEVWPNTLLCFPSTPFLYTSTMLCNNNIALLHTNNKRSMFEFVNEKKKTAKMFHIGTREHY